MLFEVTLPDGSTSVMQAHTKKQLLQALTLQEVSITKAVPKHRCKACRKAVATLQNRLCNACWTQALDGCREVWKEVPLSEQELKDLVMSFFVDG